MFVDRYWQYQEQVEAPPERHESEWYERFRSSFDQAVADRLRGGGFATHLSGGLDSTSVATTAQQTLRDQGRGHRLRAYTNCISNSEADQDLPFTRMVADAAGIPLRRFNIDDYLWSKARRPKAEPYLYHAGSEDDIFEDCWSNRLELLTGFGGDPIFTAPRLRARNLLLAGRWARLLREARERHTRGLGWPGLGLRSSRGHKSFQREAFTQCSKYLDPDFAIRYRLAERLRFGAQSYLSAEGRRGMSDSSTWLNLFQGFDPGQTAWPVRVRHPFFDTRVIASAATAPSWLWAGKSLLRGAMAGRLPEAVRGRRKTPFGVQWDSRLSGCFARDGLPSEVEMALGSQSLEPYLKQPVSRSSIPGDAVSRSWWIWLLFRGLEFHAWIEQGLDNPA